MAKIQKKKRQDFIYIVVVVRPVKPDEEISIFRPVRTWTFAHTKSHAKFLADDLRQKGHFIVDIVKAKAMGGRTQ